MPETMSSDKHTFNTDQADDFEKAAMDELRGNLRRSHKERIFSMRKY